ncbi:hypothetical protein GLOIN_2v1510133 [Rhizophagus clarus]|uniref:Uncharacterized protein n=1 Tax=Rhizophagus clarus TaxID=94130 RepID=A0A8H3QY36_9GLOM|nr:hypothetical protein GLOIN_2v1510133 [Rhizophagus clarus]
MNIDKEKRNKWTQNDDINDSEGGLKRLLISIIGIFGSDYGVYLIFETKWLLMNCGQLAKRLRNDARINVKERARRLKEFTITKYRNGIVGASYTNDNEYENFNLLIIKIKRLQNY